MLVVVLLMGFSSLISPVLNFVQVAIMLILMMFALIHANQLLSDKIQPLNVNQPVIQDSHMMDSVKQCALIHCMDKIMFVCPIVQAQP